MSARVPRRARRPRLQSRGRDRSRHRQPVAHRGRPRGPACRGASDAALAHRGPAHRVDRRPRDHRPGVLPALVAARHPAPVLASTRPTTPRTPGRCSTTATCAATSRTPTRRSSTARRPGCGQDSPSMVVHPEVGKWLIALGEKGFGMDPFGWRIASAVVGSLMVLLMCRFVRRVTGSTALGLVGGLLLSLDGLQLVLSRLALLDIFLAFFILLRGPLRRGRPTVVLRDRLARRARPGRCWRPWLVAGGRRASGWRSAPSGRRSIPLAAFGVLADAWSAGARRAFGHAARAAQARLVHRRRRSPSPALVARGTGRLRRVSWTGWLIHAERLREGAAATRSTRRTAAARRGRPRASPTPRASARSPSRCARCGTTTRTSTRSTRTSSTTAPTSTPREPSAGC